MIRRRLVAPLVAATLAVAAPPALLAQRQAGAGPVYSVVELTFTGPTFGPTDAPARDVDFTVRFAHESGGATHTVHGYWDGDGRGGTRGNAFKVRFAPTRPGRWTLAAVESNRPELRGERQGDYVRATPAAGTGAAAHGFWEVDTASAGRRWFRRSDGSHQYVVGNTHYSFVSEMYLEGKPNGSSIARDVRGNARYFKKLRFSPIGDRYPDPNDAPFLDSTGAPTYDGNQSHRPNPAWFARRTDLAVRTAADLDLVADLIMAGVDEEQTRSALRPSGNGGDPAPFLRYLVARYGAYPNVWFCLINEYDIRTPKFTAEEIVRDGRTLQSFLAYPNPVSVHRVTGRWPTALNTTPSWNDHVIIQQKLRTIAASADTILASYRSGGGDKPVVNDELSYEGAGDKHSEYDTIESHLGAFLGGGYGSTGHKSANKLGQYFAGNFDPAEHTAADNLRWLREAIDRNVSFWRLAPVSLDSSIFRNAAPGSRAMQWRGHEYVLGTDSVRAGITAALPPGRWAVTRHDAVAMRSTVVNANARGTVTFDAPASRAVLFHFRRVGE